MFHIPKSEPKTPKLPGQSIVENVCDLREEKAFSDRI
jgi:hypothetical protein